MADERTIKISLTKDPLENIKIMAPLLNKREQENVFIYVMGLYNGSSSENRDSKEVM